MIHPESPSLPARAAIRHGAPVPVVGDAPVCPVFRKVTAAWADEQE
jgi:hypothetical protein